MTNHIRWLGSFAALSACLLPQSLLANETEELRQRLEELESIVIDMESKMGGNAIANSFSSINMDFGGYYHGVAREFDTDAGEAAGFARNLLYLRIEADVSEKWSVSFGNLFGQVDGETPEHANIGGALSTDTDGDKIPDYLDTYNTATPAASNNFTGLVADQAASFNLNPLKQTAGSVDNLSTFSLNIPVDINVQYKHNDALKFTFGRQRMPVGQFSLYPMSWRHVEIPRYMLNTNGVTHIFNPFIQGLSVSGQFFPGDGAHILKYSAFSADTTVMSGGLEGVNNNEQSGFRVGYAKPDQSFSAGLNYIQGKREDRTLYGGNRFKALGADVFVNIAGFRFLAEYYDSDEGDGPEPDRKGYIVEPSYLITPQVELIARHDVMDAPIYQLSNQSVTAAAAGLAASPLFPDVATALAALDAAGIPSTVNSPSNLGKMVENSIGVNYKPVENVRLRLLFSKRTYEDLNDYEVKITSLSATASF